MVELAWHHDHGGDGPVLVLLHAFPLSSVIWQRLAPLIRADVRLVLIDLPGLGRSRACAATAGPASMTGMAQAVLDVLDHLDLHRAVIGGLSTGGYVALAIAAEHPERLSGLILASTTCWVGDPDVPEDRRELADELKRLGTLDPVRGTAADGLGESAKREQPELLHLLDDVIAESRPAGIAWTARAVASRADTSAALAELDRPVLLLFGEEDTETPPARFAHAMADLRGPDRSTRLEILADTGHLTALEQPRRVADVLLEWLDAEVT